MDNVERNVDPVADAVRQLRTALGESQQAFAYRMKTAIRTIARYETVRPPKGKALADFFRVASETGNEELAILFRNALTAEIGIAGKLTQLGALASYTIPKIHADLAVLLHDLKYGSGSHAVKVGDAIQKLETAVTEMDKLNIYMPNREQAAEASQEEE
jgi:transcriptional regulator with XRE-family HTH domain